MARDMGMAVGGVVENMSALVCAGCGQRTPLFGTGGGEIVADRLAAPLLAQVPLDAALRSAGDEGRPVVIAQPTSGSARELTRLAGVLPARRSLVGARLPLAVV
jgi:ATP-binding protein involved in chromosome partitioning